MNTVVLFHISHCHSLSRLFQLLLSPVPLFSLNCCLRLCTWFALTALIWDLTFHLQLCLLTKCIVLESLSSHSKGRNLAPSFFFSRAVDCNQPWQWVSVSPMCENTSADPLPLQWRLCAGQLPLEGLMGGQVMQTNAIRSASNFSAIESYSMLPFKNYGLLMVNSTKNFNYNISELFLK